MITTGSNERGGGYVHTARKKEAKAKHPRYIVEEGRGLDEGEEQAYSWLRSSTSGPTGLSVKWSMDDSRSLSALASCFDGSLISLSPDLPRRQQTYLFPHPIVAVVVPNVA